MNLGVLAIWLLGPRFPSKIQFGLQPVPGRRHETKHETTARNIRGAWLPHLEKLTLSSCCQSGVEAVSYVLLSKLVTQRLGDMTTDLLLIRYVRDEDAQGCAEICLLGAIIPISVLMMVWSNCLTGLSGQKMTGTVKLDRYWRVIRPVSWPHRHLCPRSPSLSDISIMSSSVRRFQQQSGGMV